MGVTVNMGIGAPDLGEIPTFVIASGIRFWGDMLDIEIL